MTGLKDLAAGAASVAVGMATGIAAVVAGNGSSSTSPASTSNRPGAGREHRKEDKDKGKAKGSDKQKEPQRNARQNGGPSGSGRAGAGRNAWSDAGVPRYQRQETRKERLKRVAETTIRVLQERSYEYRGATIQLGDMIKHTVDGTISYPDQSTMREWKNKPNFQTQGRDEVSFSILNISTLDGARILTSSYRFHPLSKGTAPPRTGILNFASATQPGGGFKNGAEAQEESIARVSSLICSLVSEEGKKFYEAHKHDKSPYHTHTMVYSPGVVVFHNDHGEGVQAYQIDVVSCAAVNAGRILEDKQSWQTAQAEIDIEGAMRERMGRILYLFEIQGIRNIVLGTFGTGVFKNKVSVVARIWAELLVGKDSRFRFSFDRIIFAVTGDSTFAQFKGFFEGWVKQKETTRPARGMQRSEWQPDP